CAGSPRPSRSHCPTPVSHRAVRFNEARACATRARRNHGR
ncbi:MAG: hypothetical protein AVDCRST_MAG88-4137, partial [uncultured Thermomicrobiales bacterium]